MMGDSDKQLAAQLAAAMGLRDNTKAPRVLSEARYAAHSSFSRDQSRRPARIPDALRALRQDLADPRFEVQCIPEDLWPYLGISDSGDLPGSSRRGLIDQIDLWLDHEQHTDSQILEDRKGGRAADSRLGKFAYRLAQIFARYTGTRATVAFDKEDGAYASPYARFAYEAFFQFLPVELRDGDKLPEGAVRMAIQRSVHPDRDTEDIDPEELAAIFPDLQERP